MSRDNRYECGLMAELKARMIRISVAVLVFLLLTAGITIAIIRSRNAAEKENYENTIKELEEENARLSDPAAQYEVASKEIDIGLIRSEIKDIAELATVEYFYTDAGKFENSAELFGKELPFSFTTKSFIAKWDGVIKAGVKADQITVEVKDVDKEIVVHIPKAEILSHEIDEDSIETLDEKDGFFNPIKIEDIREFDAVSKEAMEQRAVENGLLNKAFENAKAIIYRLIDTEVVEELEYAIVFEVIEE